jgi:branched-chain amino acid transport system ATP-binding protein
VTAILTVENLCAFYGRARVLHGLNFSLEQGTITALLGANGAGKTTALRAICNMVESTGSVTLDSKPLTGKSTEHIACLGVAHVPQGRGTFMRMTVEENLRLGAITRSDQKSVADDLERMFCHFQILRKRRHQIAAALSGGEQQMLAVARALMLRPRMMLLDEPSFGLAPLVVRYLFDVLEKVNQVDKVTVLMVEQNARLALAIADEVYVIESGRIVMSGRASDIATNDDVRKSYLGY